MLIDGGPVQAPEPRAELEKDLGAPASVVSEYIAPAPSRHLPQMVLATTLVAIFPLAISLALRASGVISSGWASVALAVALSCAASSAGSTYWRKRDRHDEVLFGELLLWGWIRRWRLERELANATRLLDLVSPGGVEIKLPGAAVDETSSVQQREHLLREQLRSIQSELGEDAEGGSETAELRRRVEETPLSPEARREADRELQRLEQIPPISPEFGIARSYLDWLLSLPWGKETGGAIDVARARQILDEDHYDLEKIKERILDYLSVRKLRQERQATVSLDGAGDAGLAASGARARVSTELKKLRDGVG